MINITGGIEPFLKGMASQVQQKCDTKMVSAVRNYLFGDPDFGGLDLASINIMRSRERGIPDYNTIREDFGLDRVSDFSEITSDKELSRDLKFLYGSVDNIDAWVGLLAEDHLEKSIYGPLLSKILEDQFYRLREGDRFYFENDPAFTAEELKEIKNTSFHDIIMRNSNLSIMPNEVFTTRKDIYIGGPKITHRQLKAIVYPNPVRTTFKVKIWLDSDSDLKLKLFAPSGRKIIETSQFLFEGENFIKDLDISTYPTGIYNLLLEVNDNYNIVKIIKD